MSRDAESVPRAPNADGQSLSSARNQTVQADLCILGGGAAGLSAAVGAAGLGLSVVVIEQAGLGGDCLYTGCVPSKALLASAHCAQMVRQAAQFGVKSSPPDVEFAAVMARLRRIQQEIGRHDSAGRLQALGCRVLTGRGAFVDGRHMAVIDGPDHGVSVGFRRALIAVGSTPVWPWGGASSCPSSGESADPLPNAPSPVVPDNAPSPVVPDGEIILTTDSVFSLTACPEHLVVVGGGPVGCELAQAFCRLGARVTLLASTLLADSDRDLVAIRRAAMQADGVDLREGETVAQISRLPDEEQIGRVQAVLASGEVVGGSHLLVATGRRVATEALGLSLAGVRCGSDGMIWHDGGLRTSNRRVYVAGDAAGGPFHSHLAGAQAGVVLRRAVFALPGKSPAMVPRVVYGEPEVAEIGMTAEAARAQGTAVEVVDLPFSDLGRAVMDQPLIAPETLASDVGSVGLLRVVVAAEGRWRGRVLGVGCAGPGAGEVLAPWIVLANQQSGLRRMAGALMPYPSYCEASRLVAGRYFAPRLFSSWGRRLARWMMRVGDGLARWT